MSKTWSQIQWRKNNDTLDFTQKYEIYRKKGESGVTPSDVLIMEVEQGGDGPYILVSDSPDIKPQSNDDLKTYYGPIPYDDNPPPTPENLTITPHHDLNTATISWSAVEEKTGVYWYYRLRAIDDHDDPSDMSYEVFGEIYADMADKQYCLEYSPDGINWTALEYTDQLEYTQENVDINGPMPVTNEVAYSDNTDLNELRIHLQWKNSASDIGTPTYYYRIRTVDNAADLFPGHPNNYSPYSPVHSPIEVKVEVTHGNSGVEIRYRNSKVHRDTFSLSMTGTSNIFLGNTQIIPGTLYVKNNTTGDRYLQGIDYTIIWELGLISRIDSGNIADGELVDIYYDYNDGIPASDDDDILDVYDGTYFLNGYGGDEEFLHSIESDMDAFNYRIRVKDNYGNWSLPVYIEFEVGDFTPPPAPSGLTLTAY